MSLQVKLLRVIQEREYEPLGATTTVKADVRIITASKTDLSILVAKDLFRDDLFYRINVITLELPPLKERRDDIPLLIEHFIEKYNKKVDRNISGISNEVKEILLQYDYSGNVRQLENIIEHAFVMSLLQLDDDNLLQEVYDTAIRIKREIYGNRLGLFAPLYISNLCKNECLYCAFRKDYKKLVRKALNQDKIKEEIEIVIRAKKIVRDIKETNEVKASLSHNLIHASKLAAVGELASGIAHEINNPLAIINEEVGLMKDMLIRNSNQK